MKKEWIKNKRGGNYLLDNKKGKVFLSYQPNDFVRSFGIFDSENSLDSENPETAIVLIKDKKIKLDNEEKLVNRYLIYRGDRRKELEKIYPNVEKLKKHWIEHGGHFWSDSLEN